MSGYLQRTFRSAMVIARRDYVATVWSRSFLMFLLGPLIAVGFGALLGNVGGRVDEAALRPSVAVIASVNQAAPLSAAYDRLAKRGVPLPDLRVEVPSGDVQAQSAALLSAAKQSASVVLTGWPDAPRLTGSEHQVDALAPPVQMMADEVALAKRLDSAGIARPTVAIARAPIAEVKVASSADRHLVARAAQTTLFVLTLMLAGMLLSNVVEEKSNKVIEVLAAAVPVDAIFLGKLIAMLGMSLTGIACWGSILGGAVLAGSQSLPPLPVPAVGWPMFVALGVLYFVMNYMIIGGLFLGVGSQAASVREVQTLSMPVTMMQLGVYALGSAALGDLHGSLGLFAAVLPVSSPLTMLARAAEEQALWPHLLAFAWQALWVGLIIRFAARRFRTGVLKSGAQRTPFWRRKAAV